MHKSKKVVFLIPTFPVLSETFIEREVYELKKRGKVDFIVACFDKGSSFNYPELNALTYRFKLKSLDIIAGKIYFALYNPRVLITTLIQSFKIGQGLSSGLYIWLKSIGYAYMFKKTGCSHIHAHFFSSSSTIGYFASQLLNISFGISGHAKDIFDNALDSNSKPELVAEKVAYARYAVLCNKKAYETCLAKVAQADRSKVHMLHHGVDFSLLNKLPAKDTPKTKIPTIYYVGRFVEKKGIIFLLEAVKILKEKGVQTKTKIAGFGPEYGFLKNFVISNDLVPDIEFINNGKGIDNFSSLKYMNEADLIVVPAINLEDGDSDGLPNIILEAGMLAKPVITTSAGSILELIKHNYNGIVVEQRNEVKLADAIYTVLNNPELANTIGNNLREDVTRKFDLSLNVVELENLLLQQ